MEFTFEEINVSQAFLHKLFEKETHPSCGVGEIDSTKESIKEELSQLD
jgi:hypothetical protein